MHTPVGTIKHLTDIEVIERAPLQSYYQVHSSYEALQRAAQRHPHKSALKYFIDGSCFDPMHIPLRARWRALAARLRYGSAVAAPYEEYSFLQLFERVNQTARLLQACGVTRHDVVSLLLPNLPETVMCLWAAETVGVVNPINPLLETDIIAGILRAANSKVLITVGELAGVDIWRKVAAIRAEVPSLQNIIIIKGNAPVACIRYHTAIHAFSTAALDTKALPALHDVASLFNTGGTTGLPKLVCGTHQNKIANVHMLLWTAPVTQDDVAMVVLPLFHVNAAVNCLLTVLMGMTCVLAGPAGFRTPGIKENFFAILRYHRVSFFSAVPTIFAALLQQTQNVCAPTVRFAISAAAALPVAVKHAFTAQTGILILEGYGQTEATVATCLTPFAAAHQPGSVGMRLPFVRLCIAQLDEEKKYVRACAVNEIGHLLVAGEHVSVGYLEPAQNETLWVLDAQGQCWLNSGDLARIDAEGYVWLTGRAKELIIRGGHNIDPRMIEEALQSHPAVILAAAVGRPDAQVGEVPVAYVTVQAGADVSSEVLLQYAAATIPERAALPKAISIVASLPLTPVGKIYKPKLVQWAQEHAFQQTLRELQHYGRDLQVKVCSHAEHGQLTRINLTLIDEQDRAVVTRLVADAMRPFAMHYDLCFTT